MNALPLMTFIHCIRVIVAAIHRGENTTSANTEVKGAGISVITSHRITGVSAAGYWIVKTTSVKASVISAYICVSAIWRCVLTGAVNTHVSGAYIIVVAVYR